jgi:hypothetical protein
MNKLDRSDDFDFLDLGDDTFVLRCDVSRDLQRAYDAAKRRSPSPLGNSELDYVCGQIRRRVSPDDIIKSDGLPELRKVAGRTQVVCEYDHDRAIMLAKAHDTSMRRRFPGSLGKDIHDQIARVTGGTIDMSKVPERLRFLYMRAPWRWTSRRPRMSSGRRRAGRWPRSSPRSPPRGRSTTH